MCSYKQEARLTGHARLCLQYSAQLGMSWVCAPTCILCTCRSETFIKAYANSELRQRNIEELHSAMQQHSSMSKDALKELSVKRATVTPFWWALYIMFKVRHCILLTLTDHLGRFVYRSAC